MARITLIRQSLTDLHNIVNMGEPGKYMTFIAPFNQRQPFAFAYCMLIQKPD